MSQRALILGPGQDGSFLADILLERGWEVHILYRRSSADNLWRIRHVLDRVTLHQGDLLDATSLLRALTTVKPHTLFNTADQDHVGWSYDLPGYAMAVTAGAVATLLELVRQVNRDIRVFQPVSALMFGDAAPPQNEETPINPQSPYAIAKAAAYYTARHYRREHGLFVSTGILFNHDSPRRHGDYLLHKICRGAVAIAAGKQECLTLGCLDMAVDIGYARDFMEGVCDLMSLDKPDDFVLATGTGRRIYDLAIQALHAAGVYSHNEWFLKADPTFARPGPQPRLVGDIAKAQQAFGFAPKHDMRQLIGMLVRHFRENA